VKKYLIAGMQRTGHHAVSVWMLHQNSGIREFSIQTISPWMFALESNNSLHILANNPFKTEEHSDKVKFDSIIQETEPDTVIITHEQEKLGQTSLEAAKHQWFWPPKMTIVLREFKNWVASCVRMAERDNKPVDEEINEDAVKLYDNHITQHLEGKDSDSIVFVLFDKWTKDKQYRKTICNKLGLTFTDVAINQLSIFGGGSSFDGMNYLKEASRMNVTNRYKTMEDNPFYKSIIHNHADVLLKSNEVFS
jgi:hypothetical protein